MKRSLRASGPGAYDLLFEHATADGAAVDTSQHRTTRRAVPEAEVSQVLERFAQLPAVQMLEIEPQITIRGPHVRLVVRPHQGKLLACDLLLAERVWRDMTPADILHALHGSPLGKVIAAKPESVTALPSKRSPRWSLVFLALGLGLNTYVVVNLFVYAPAVDFVPTGDGRPSPEVVADVTGSYAAVPPATYDRIVLQAPNTVVFRNAGTGKTVTDTYLVGTYNGRPRLITGQNGFIDAPDRRWLEFGGRRYERERATKP